MPNITKGVQEKAISSFILKESQGNTSPELSMAENTDKHRIVTNLCCF